VNPGMLWERELTSTAQAHLTISDWRVGRPDCLKGGIWHEGGDERYGEEQEAKFAGLPQFPKLARETTTKMLDAALRCGYPPAEPISLESGHEPTHVAPCGRLRTDRSCCGRVGIVAVKTGWVSMAAGIHGR